MTLQGKTAVVTGSGRGIGRSISLALAAKGCNVCINFFRNRTAAEKTAAEAAALGVKTAVVRANVGDRAQVERLVHEAAEQLGSVDIFVGNAASGVMQPIMAIDDKAWAWTMDINARSVLAGVQAAVPYMRKRGWGRVITITSLGGRRVAPEYGVVGVSKAALDALTRALAVELAPDGIIVNGISPGLVLTDALDHFPNRDEMIAHARSNTPAARLASPDDVGALAAWLCSDEASMIVGQMIEVDGGYSLMMMG